MRHCIVDHGHHFDLGDLSGLDDSAQGNDGNQADLAEHCNCNIVDYGHHFDLGDMLILVIMLVVIRRHGSQAEDSVSCVLKISISPLSRSLSASQKLLEER